MDKRTFLKLSSTAAAGLGITPGFVSVNGFIQNNQGNFKLPELKYPYHALEPVIDAKTMEIHYSKHHQAYVANLNKAVIDENKTGKSLLQLFTDKNLSTAIRNNLGGHFNHSLYWEILNPENRENEVMKAMLTNSFGSVEALLNELVSSGMGVFGSGWVWLCKHKDGTLFVTTSANQDNPLMEVVPGKKGIPILGIDVWEHAYYLNYQNNRKLYLESLVKVINWNTVYQNYKQ